MKRLTNLLAITLLTSCVTAFAQEQEEICLHLAPKFYVKSYLE